MTALVTGGRGGIGRAIVEAHVDAVPVDLPEFDVGSREAWASLEGEFDAAFLNAGIAEHYDPATLVGRNVGVQGFYLGRLLRHEPEVVGDAVGELLALWQTGALKPIVGAEIPLTEVDRAHELVESRKSVGKVVLVP